MYVNIPYMDPIGNVCWSFKHEHPLHRQWHPIPSPTTSWSWPFFPSTSCKWRCYLPKIPLTNPTCEKRTMAHRSSQSTSSSNSKMWVFPKNWGIYLQIIYIFLMKLFHGKNHPFWAGYVPLFFGNHPKCLKKQVANLDEVGESERYTP